MTPQMLKEVKLLKGIDDNMQDDLLVLLIEESTQRVMSYINSSREESLSELPNELEFIIRDVTIKRFNKIDAEGAKSSEEEGKSLTWEDGYLDEYKNILSKYTEIKRGSFWAF